MNLFVLCSALNNSYIAFKYNNEVYSEIIKSDENYHSLYLIQNIKNVLNNKNISLTDFDYFAVNTGPGSFTGIRVALTIAKIMAGELNKPLVSLNTAEILLNAYNAEYLFMDARRDMYFKCDKESIELIKKDDLNESLSKFQDKKVVCDKRCLNLFQNAICFEEEEKNIGETMLLLAQEKFSKENPENFNYMNVKANYIQTPPIF